MSRGEEAIRWDVLHCPSEGSGTVLTWLSSIFYFILFFMILDQLLSHLMHLNEWNFHCSWPFVAETKYWQNQMEVQLILPVPSKTISCDYDSASLLLLLLLLLAFCLGPTPCCVQVCDQVSLCNTRDQIQVIHVQSKSLTTILSLWPLQEFLDYCFYDGIFFIILY